MGSVLCFVSTDVYGLCSERKGSLAENVAAVTVRVAHRLAGGGPPSGRGSTCFLGLFPLVQFSSGQDYPPRFTKLCHTDGSTVC